MSHRHVQERLGAYLDAQLDPSQCHEIEAHLTACSACRDELEALRVVHAKLQTHGVPEPDESYWQRFTTRVDARLPGTSKATTPWPQRIRDWFVPAGRLGWARAATALATVTLLVYVGVQSFDTEEIGVDAVQQQRAPAIGEASRGPAPERSQGLAAPAPGSEPRVREEAPTAADAWSGRPIVTPPPTEVAWGAVDAPSLPTQQSGETGGVGTTGIAAQQSARENEGAAGMEHPLTMQSAAESMKSSTQSPDRKRKLEPAVPSAAAAPRPAEAQGLEASRRAVLDQAVAQTDEPVLQADELAALQLRQSLDAGAAVSLRESERLAEAVRSFVAAALAEDVVTAERVHVALENSQPEAVDELRQMKTWRDLRDAGGEKVERLAGRAQTPSAPSTARELHALDALLWPRRDQAAFRDLVVRMATDLESASASFPQLRSRARAYLAYLAESTQGADERALWLQRFEALQP